MRFVVSLFLIGAAFASAQTPQKAPPPPKAPLKIEPGKVIVPTDRMRRIWGELVSVDLKNRTGTFRNEGNDEVMPFKVMPYAELLHHATFGDLQDYRIGERAIFRMHEDKDGNWTWLTYIQDEMNFLNGHKEYYWVDRIDSANGKIEFTQANGDKTFEREKGLILETDANTKYWRDAKPARFEDIKIGDKLRTQTYGIGKGKVRRCWHVFLDEASLLDFQAKQMIVHRERQEKQGLVGYLDAKTDGDITMVMFQENREQIKSLKAKSPVRVSLAGPDRQAIGTPVVGAVTTITPKGNLNILAVKLEKSPEFPVGSVVRVFPGK